MGGLSLGILRIMPRVLKRIEVATEAHKLIEDGNITEAKAKFAQAREWDNKVVWGDEGLSEK